MASLLSAVRTRFFDKSNKPLAGGKVFTYEANSTNPKVTWSDEALTVQNTNPVLLDNEGTALIFFSGKYRFRIEDQYGVLIEDNPSVTSLVGIDGVTADIVKDGNRYQSEINAEQQEFYDYQNGTVNFETFNIPEKYGADSTAADNSVALQAWLNSGKTLHIRPFKTYKFNSQLNLSIVDQSIIGLTHNKYGASKLQFTGFTGTALKGSTNIGYPYFSGWQLVGTTVTTGAVFELNTVGIDLTLGGSINAQNWFVNGFETIAKSNGNTFYNRFIDCRFSSFKTGFDGFAAYNLQFLLCRFYQFTDAIRTAGGAGPINIKFNSFEQFNGVIHRSNNDKCEVNFDDNYVEMFDKVALPTNFTKATNQTKGNFFGGNILFLGYYSKFKATNNKLSIGGVFRVAAFSECDSLVSEGNVLSLYDTNNNLGVLFTNAGIYKSVNVNDIRYGSLGADGGYSQTYSRSSFNSISNLRNKYFYYDCILDATQPIVNRLQNYPTLLNGWTISVNSGGTTVKALALEDGGVRIYGSIDGSAKTANTILNIPATHRPTELGTTQSYMLFQVSSSNGTSVPVVLRYFYGTGDLELFTTPPNLGNILINIVIPPRI